MAEVGEGVVSSGGIHAPSGDVRPLQSSVKLQAQEHSPAFGEAYSRIALTPTVLGEIGSTMAANASNKIAEITGKELGRNPMGDILPPLTNFDKAYSNAYGAQAEVTLGLQASQMMAKGQEQLDQLYQLSPGDIQSYTANMAEGMQDIFAQAPSNVRTQLENQYGHQLISASHNLNERMISQNKQRSASEAATWRGTRSQSMMDLVREGTPKALSQAKSIRDSIDQNIKSNAAIGMISPSEAHAALVSNKLNFESAASIAKFRDAQLNNKGDQYLASIAYEKIGNLSWSESDVVRNNTLKYAQATMAADQRYQALLTAEANNDIAMGALTEARQAYYKENMTPTNFLNTMTSWTSRQKKESKINLKSDEIMKDPQNARSYIGADNKTIDYTFNRIKRDIIRNAKEDPKNPRDLSDDEADIAAQSSMGVAVPAFTEKINRLAQTGNPADIIASRQLYNAMKDTQGNKILGVKDESVAMMNLFDYFSQRYPDDPAKAAELAHQTLFDKSPDIVKLNNAKTNGYLTKHGQASQQLTSWARKLGGFGSGVMQNETEYTSNVVGLMKSYMQLTNGNEEIAEKMVRDTVAKNYGVTHINGREEIAKYPVEGITGLEDSAPLIQQDIINQITPDFAASEELFNSNKTTDSYWRVKAGRPSFDEYLQAKNTIRENESSIKASARAALFEDTPIGSTPFEKEFNIIRQFEKGEPIKVEQVFRDGHVVEQEISARTSYAAQRDPSTGMVISGMQIMVHDPKTGIMANVVGHFGGIKGTAQYYPDVAYLQQRYMAANHPGAIGKSPKEIIEEYKQLQEEKKTRVEAAASLFSASPFDIPGGR